MHEKFGGATSEGKGCFETSFENASTASGDFGDDYSQYEREPGDE